MTKTIKEERLRWVLPIIRKEVKLVEVARICPHGKRSLERWTAAYKAGGEEALEPRSTEPKAQPRETSIRIKERIIEIRNDTKKCALKIHWQLQKEGIEIDERTIGKILKKEGLVRKYRVRKITYKYIKAVRKPGELVEIDVKYVPGKVAGRRYYQYTAIDTSSRWRYLKVYDEQTSYHSILFLQEVMGLFPYKIQAIKTDNGSIFTNYYTGYRKSTDPLAPRLHAFDIACKRNGLIHYLIDPGKPAQNGKVERSHRTDREEFWNDVRFRTVSDLKKQHAAYMIRYNTTREHLALDGKTPTEYLTNCPI